MNGTGQVAAKSNARRLQCRRHGGDHRRIGDGAVKLVLFPIGARVSSANLAISLAEAYRYFAPRYAGLGIPVFPIRDKTPLVKNWQRMGCQAAIALANREAFRSAGIGMCCGRKSGITIVDVDDPGEGPLLAALARFGDTPLIVRTHSGKHHLYYRDNGERRQLGLEGLKLDILGEGGFVVLPPSTGPLGRYQFLRGSYENFRNPELLPTINGGALLPPSQASGGRRRPLPISPSPLAQTAPTIQGRDVGRRDVDLARACRIAAATTNRLEELETFALGLGSTFDPPLEPEQTLQKAKQAWKYKQEGRLLFPGCEPTAVIRLGEAKTLIRHPVEIRLLVLIRLCHGATPGKRFALAVKALSKKLGCRAASISAAIETLIALGHLERVHRGGRRKGDASLYRLKSAYPTGAECN